MAKAVIDYTNWAIRDDRSEFIEEIIESLVEREEKEVKEIFADQSFRIEINVYLENDK